MRSGKVYPALPLLIQLCWTYYGVQSLFLFKNPAERAIRKWSTQLLAEYSTSSGCLAVAFSSVPNPEAIGVYRIRLLADKGADRGARDIGPMNVSWEAAEHFAASDQRNGTFTLLRVPIPSGIQASRHAYKLHLLPLMYRNNTEVLSMAKYSKLEPQCHVTFSPKATLPQRTPTLASAADCAKRWSHRPPLLDEAFNELGLGVKDDGCCVARLGEAPQPLADVTPLPLQPSQYFPLFETAAAASAGAAGSLLASCCAFASVRAARILRRKRVVLAPSGAPYSLLAAHCRSVHTKEPLINQGMAYRVYLRPWDFRRLCKAVLRPLWLRL